MELKTKLSRILGDRRITGSNQIRAKLHPKPFASMNNLRQHWISALGGESKITPNGLAPQNHRPLL